MKEEHRIESAPGTNAPAVRSLVIPLHGMALLLPNAMVAEVATLGEIRPAGPGPAWLLGRINWRGLTLPLVAFERLAGGPECDVGRRSRAVVLNTLNGSRELPFVALLSQGIPRLVLATESALRPADEEAALEGVLCRVRVAGSEMLIPDIDRIEALLEEQRLSAGPAGEGR